jgi:hypothetical protein
LDGSAVKEKGASCMSSYHQMGHDSENLLFEQSLASFRGAILSPVNDDIHSVVELVTKIRLSHLSIFDLIFDPQLYFPQSERGQLRTWAHFPSDVDTADISSMSWWQSINQNLSQIATKLRVDAVCSPAVVPRSFAGTDYYSRMVEVGDHLAQQLSPKNIKTLQTVVAGFDDLGEPQRALEIASIISRSKSARIFLVLSTDVEPRRELAEIESIKGAMRLIQALEESGLQTLVGFCSSDVALWKSAGAHSCATGKFFNLRRFTRSRFEEPGGGGGQLPYWFEERLFAYLREPDLLRVEQEGLLSPNSQQNPYFKTIMDSIRGGKPWVRHAWRQYLYWFADFEARASSTPKLASNLLKESEAAWREIEDKDILMDEVRNDGKWLRPWRKALADFAKF